MLKACIIVYQTFGENVIELASCVCKVCCQTLITSSVFSWQVVLEIRMNCHGLDLLLLTGCELRVPVRWYIGTFVHCCMLSVMYTGSFLNRNMAWYNMIRHTGNLMCVW